MPWAILRGRPGEEERSEEVKEKGRHIEEKSRNTECERDNKEETERRGKKLVIKWR